MLVIYIFILMFTNSINHLKKNIHSTFINRITIITLIISILFTFNSLYFQLIGKGISIYSGLYQTTVQSQIVEILLLIVGISILLGWPFILINIKRHGVWNKYNPEFGSGVKEVINIKKSDQYSLIAIFSILGGSLLMSSLDLLSMYLSIELQSFALYILATLYKEQLSATSAGLKYFLLGSLSSCFILLGSAIIYSYTGLTQFEAISTLMSVPYIPIQNEGDILSALALPQTITTSSGTIPGVMNPLPMEAFALSTPEGEGGRDTLKIYHEAPGGLLEMWDINKAFYIGLIIIIIGFLFKISAAPFYQWAPDVYDGTPTIVTVWLSIIVKLTIFIFLLELVEFIFPITLLLMNHLVDSGLSMATIFTGLFSYKNIQGLLYYNTGIFNIQIKNLLLISSLLSLLIGTIAGLSQIKVKRLLAFSSISHVGFLLLALGIYTQKSVDSFIFYLIQYSVTSLNVFLILLAFGYLLINSKYFSSLHPYGIKVSLSTPPCAKRGPDSYKAPLRKAMPLAGEEVVSVNKTYETHNDNNTPLEKYTYFKQAAQTTHEENIDINYLIELKGQLYKNPVLSISLAICLFSMAGIPPLIGFFSKQFVLFSSIENGNHFLSIVAILVSVISASYYLRLIKIIFFDSFDNNEPLLPLSVMPALHEKENYPGAMNPLPMEAFALSTPEGEGGPKLESRWLPVTISAEDLSFKVTSPFAGKAKVELQEKETEGEVLWYLSNIHSYIIAILTFLILFFFLDPSILLNGTQLISLTIFYI